MFLTLPKYLYSNFNFSYQQKDFLLQSQEFSFSFNFNQIVLCQHLILKHSKAITIIMLVQVLQNYYCFMQKFLLAMQEYYSRQIDCLHLLQQISQVFVMLLLIQVLLPDCYFIQKVLCRQPSQQLNFVLQMWDLGYYLQIKLALFTIEVSCRRFLDSNLVKS